MADESVELGDAIAALRQQLDAALRAGQGEEVRFRLGPVELEFALEVKKDVKAQGGVKFWVISLGGGGGVAHSSHHRVKLVLQPVDESGADLEVHSKRAERPR